ncbi:hypothetical protein Droror1_Dr00003709 [Drosera rotundifolia]
MSRLLNKTLDEIIGDNSASTSRGGGGIRDRGHGGAASSGPEVSLHRRRHHRLQSSSFCVFHRQNAVRISVFCFPCFGVDDDDRSRRRILVVLVSMIDQPLGCQSAGSSHRDHVGAGGSSSAEVAMAGKAQESCACRSAECIVKSCNCFAGNRICTRRCRCSKILLYILFVDRLSQRQTKELFSRRCRHQPRSFRRLHPFIAAVRRPILRRLPSDLSRRGRRRRLQWWNLNGSARRDSISSLPTEIIVSILQWLPLRDAVRTCILSRKWRSNWELLSQLVFNARICEVAFENKVSDRILRYNSIFDTVILRHDAPINNLVLDLPLGIDDVSRWLQYASRHQVKELTLRYDYLLSPHHLVLTSRLFSCSELTNLTLCNCFPAQLKSATCFGFPKLVSLTITITDPGLQESIERLISGCPLLQKLTMIFQTKGSNPPLVLNNVIRLEVLRVKLDSYMDFRARMTNVRSISFVMSSGGTWESRSSYICSFFNQLPHIERIELRGTFWQNLVRDGGIPRKLPFVLQQLRTVKFYVSRVVENYHNATTLAICLLGSAPNLESFELKVVRGESCEDHELPEADEDSRHEVLRTVLISGITGLKMELKLIRFLLACCPALEAMNVCYRPDLGGDQVIKISQELIRFRRASTTVEVNFRALEESS